MNVGYVIAQLRREHGFSQEQMAGMLFVSKDLVSKWETGTRRPDYAMIERISELFGVPADAILEKDRYIFEELSGYLPEELDMTAEELAGSINRFLRSIAREEAVLFVRRYYLLEPFSTIAERTGLRENHIRSRLSKCRKKMIRFVMGDLQ